jgi:hypothetical protein
MLDPLRHPLAYDCDATRSDDKTQGSKTGGRLGGMLIRPFKYPGAVDSSNTPIIAFAKVVYSRYTGLTGRRHMLTASWYKVKE